MNPDQIKFPKDNNRDLWIDLMHLEEHEFEEELAARALERAAKELERNRKKNEGRRKIIFQINTITRNYKLLPNLSPLFSFRQNIYLQPSIKMSSELIRKLPLFPCKGIKRIYIILLRHSKHF